MAELKIDTSQRLYRLTPEEARRRYAPAKTLGASEEIQQALDTALSESGSYSLLAHAAELGQAALPQFLGYSALQGISQNGLIRACVETVSDDMTRAWIKLGTIGDGTDTADEELIPAIEIELTRLKARNVFHEAAELVGYEGGALIYLDTGAEGTELLTPLPLTPASVELRNGGLKRLTVIDPVNVFPGDYNSTNPLRPDYYNPSTWWVLGRQVHASRLVRLVANEVPILLKPAYNFLGIPQAQILYDYVIHFQDSRTAANRLLQKFSTMVFKTNIENVLYSASGTEQLEKRVRMFAQERDNDGIAVIDYNTEDIVKLDTTLTGTIDIVRQGLELIAAINRTPAVKLLGISPSGFNATGESDIRNYYDHIRSQQEKVFRAALTTVLKAIQISATGSINEGLSFEFAPLSVDDKAQMANLAKTRADTAGVYIDRGVITPEEARIELIRDVDSGYNGLANDLKGEADTGEIDYPTFE